RGRRRPSDRRSRRRLAAPRTRLHGHAHCQIAMFPMTHHSAVADLKSDHAARRKRSLDLITRAYWRPIYKYVRLRWVPTGEQAEDLTQSFFASALERDMLASYEPGRGRLRTFLRTCLDRHPIDQHRR